MILAVKLLPPPACSSVPLLLQGNHQSRRGDDGGAPGSVCFCVPRAGPRGEALGEVETRSLVRRFRVTCISHPGTVRGVTKDISALQESERREYSLTDGVYFSTAQIDAAGSGVIESDAFISYLLHQFREKAARNNALLPFQDPPTFNTNLFSKVSRSSKCQLVSP